MKNFIEQQQELLVTSELLIEIEDIALKPFVLEKKLDTLIAQVITNTGEEMERLLVAKLAESEFSESKGLSNLSEGIHEAVDIMKQHITNVTGAV